MNGSQAGLKLEQAPPFAVPLAFFVAAPLFALLAAALLLWEGPGTLASRWTPAALSATHLLALGFMAMAMLGAMMQILPVLAGAPMPWPRVTGAVTHVSVTLGTLLLCAGLLESSQAAMRIALPLLALGFAAFVASAVLGLALAGSRSAVASDFWRVVIALVLAVGLGLALAAPRAWDAFSSGSSLFALHPGWALAGWTGLLTAAVAKQVVPMFQITPQYPKIAENWFTPVVLGLLLVWSVAAVVTDVAGVAAAPGIALAAAYLLFALETLTLQRRRRRRTADVTLNFWRLGMVSLALSCLLWAGRFLGWLPEAVDPALGTLAILGTAMSLINGMLYKILPFLAWFHLSARGAGRGLHMMSFLAVAPQKRQFACHAAAVVLLTGAAAGGELLFYPGALCLGLSALLLAWNSFEVLRVYRRACAKAVPQQRPVQARLRAAPAKR